ncbi:MAG TPA: hypothetical protein VF968_02770 [Actinomycetota bacterium]
MHQILLTESGAFTLASKPSPQEDLVAFLIEVASDDQVADVIEATLSA